MNLVFIGASTFGLRCMEACINVPGINVTGVVTAPQIFSISYRPTGVTNVLHADVASFARAHSIPTQILESSMSDPGLFETVEDWKPDAFLVAGWYHMIPNRWRKLAPSYGLHASLLPNYSGGAPLVWAIINNESKTGVTLFQMDDGVDSGPIAGQKEEPILPDDTIATLYSRIEERGLELVREVLPLLAGGSLTLHAQDEAGRRIMPQRSPADGDIDWQQDAEMIERLIRAQTRPYPGAFSTLNGKPLHIWKVRLCQVWSESIEPGRIYRKKHGNYFVSCGVGAVELIEVSYEQKEFSLKQLPELFGDGGQLFVKQALDAE